MPATLKNEYLLLFTFRWEKESLIGQHFFVGPIKKRKQIFILQNSKERKTKVPDKIEMAFSQILANREWFN